MKKNKKYSWEEAGSLFDEERIIQIPVEEFKNIGNADKLPYSATNKEMIFIENMITESIKTLLYSLDMLLSKFGYIEKVGRIKFDTEDAGKNHCFGILKSQNTWKENFALHGNDYGQEGIVSDTFPHNGDPLETYMYDTGQIVSYSLDKEDLQNGVVVDREVIWSAVRAIFERLKAQLRWKIDRMLIKNRIRQI